METHQLPLHLPLRDDALFDNFLVGKNTQAIFALQNFITNRTEPFIYCYGETGSGRTHLLQATCHALEKNKQVFYLPLTQHADFSPEIFESLETQDYICLDDIDAIIGNQTWEEALFYFYNRARDCGVSLLVSAQCPPQQLSCVLPDLQSRMTSSLTLAIHPLTDVEKIQVLQLRAKDRGLLLSEDVANYLIHHYSRKLSDLMRILSKCDELSLITKRKITIPFVKQALTEPSLCADNNDVFIIN